MDKLPDFLTNKLPSRSQAKRKKREGRMKKLLLLLLSAGVLAVLLFVYFRVWNNQTDQGSQPLKSNTKTIETTTSTATLSAIGDVLIHDRVYEKAYVGDKKYNFSPMLSKVKDLLSQSDITIANQESMIGGTEIGVSSYPMFNSPFEIGDILKEFGVDLVTIANNHSLDKGERGILKATEHWDQIGMMYTGAFRSQDDRGIIRIIEKNGIKFSFLAYTYGTNGMPIPQGKDYLVNILDENKMKNDIQEAKKKSDVVVVSVHFGQEYQREPSAEQKKWVQLLAEDGADIIIGHHPHVLQPPAWITRSNGEKVFVAYSLGNFISGQRWDYKDIGGIMRVTVEKTVTGDQKKIQLKDPSFIPTWVDSTYSVQPLSQVKEQASAFEGIKKFMCSSLPELKFTFSQ